MKDPSALKEFLKNTSLYSLLRPMVRHYFLNEGVSDVNVAFSYQEMFRSLVLISQIKKENPEANFLVYYIPESSSEYKNKDAYDSNILIFNNICKELGLRCATAGDILKDKNISEVYLEKRRTF